MEKKFFLVNAFEEFHKILFDYRKKIVDSSLFLNNEDISEKNNIISNIQRHFIVFIRDKSSQIFNESGLIGEKIFTEVSYIMASLADEIFLFLVWDGQQYWQKNLLERKLFNSANSGEKIFEKINAVLSDNSVEGNEIALIYFYCLALGFKGAWKGLSDCEEKIKELKEKLYFKIYYKDSKFFKEKLFLFPDSYNYLYKETALNNKTSTYFWKILGITLVVVYFVVVEILWNYNLHNLLNILRNFLGEYK